MPRSSVIAAVANEVTPVPLTIEGLQIWVDASDETTITDSSGSVSQWDDKSGNGNHVTQGTPENQPSTGTRTINNLNTIEFNPGTELLSNTSFTLSEPFTIFSVSESDNVTATNYVWADSNGSNVLYNNGGISAFSVFFGSVVTFATANSNGVPYIVTVVGDSTDGIGRNGAALTTGNAGAGSFDKFNIGNRDDFARDWDGAIAEILVYNSALSATDRATVEEYLASKWGITLV